jgi:hypothetical protein
MNMLGQLLFTFILIGILYLIQFFSLLTAMKIFNFKGKIKKDSAFIALIIILINIVISIIFRFLYYSRFLEVLGLIAIFTATYFLINKKYPEQTVKHKILTTTISFIILIIISFMMMLFISSIFNALS